MPRARTDVSLPIALETGSGRPLYRQVYDWLQRAIVEGRLKPGQRVPSTRRLAADLQVSRVPILTAFEQLHAEGYLESTVGAGTRVAAAMPEQALRRIARRRLTDLPGPRRISRQAADALSRPDPLGPPSTLGAFRVSLPALSAFPTDVWTSLLARHARRAAPELMDYSDPMGYLPFREALAEYLGAARAVRCDASQVMIVSGSQQGLQLAARALLDPGDPVWIEEPGYPGAQRAFGGAAGAELVPLPIDRDGLDVDAGLRRRPDARAAYVTPSHQYPLGVTMSASRRVKLLDWAAEANAWIFEDDYDSEFRFDSRPLASLQGVDEAGRVIYFGTLSKVLFPGLRIGYVVVPKDLVGAFGVVRTAMDIFPPALLQAALADFIREGQFARHIRRMRMLYMSRAAKLADAIQRSCGGQLKLAGPPAGMHLSAFLPPGVDDQTFARLALDRGVTVLPLSTFHLAAPARHGVVLGFGDADEAAIERGVGVLAQVLRALTARDR